MTLRLIVPLLGLLFVAGCDSGVDSAPIPANDAPSPSATTTNAAAATERPNVLFILVDDMGWNDAGYNGSEIATPVLDEIASLGVRLDRNYAYAICSPTRAALMTGQSALALGIDGPMADDKGLSTDIRIMPQYFKDLGYQTSLVGKWHLGIGHVDYLPSSRGFDYSYGFLGGWVDFYTHVYSKGFDWHRNSELLREEGYATDLLADDAIRVIAERDQSKPFFMFLSLNAPHFPLQYTPTPTGLNEHIPFGDRQIYAEMMTYVDARIGDVIDSLESEGILDNTIIVFSSDNGATPGYAGQNTPLRGSKGSPFEGGLRVPGLIWWPGRVEGGRVLDQQIVMHDWLPTLLEAAGGDPSVVVDLYGQSMWPAIANDVQVTRNITTLGSGGSHAVFDYPWKLVSHTATNEGAPMLFNVVTDPEETTDLASEQPEIFARLDAAHKAMALGESHRDMSNVRAATYFRNADDTGWDYNVRLQEIQEPWLTVIDRGE